MDLLKKEPDHVKTLPGDVAILFQGHKMRVSRHLDDHFIWHLYAFDMREVRRFLELEPRHPIDEDPKASREKRIRTKMAELTEAVHDRDFEEVLLGAIQAYHQKMGLDE
jgi:hypothetical protein